ncbi:MAG: antiterminator LoaP [Clostridia bacterium]|nr:antiterminator LoaP [Clostridia bacterium]
MRWYVIFVETGYEEQVCKYINKAITDVFEDVNFNLLVPKRKIYERKQGIRREVVKMMFPGYVLVETDNILDFYLRLKGSPRVIKVLRNKEVFSEITNDEIKQILFLVNENGLIDISEAFIVNDKVQIINGPLYGNEGIIKRIDKRKGRAKVELSINYNSLLIDLGINLLQKYEGLGST